MLPAPKHSSGKEVGRVLLPHSLSKKPVSTSNTAKKPPVKANPKSSELHKVKAGISTVKEDSDDEEESGSFFSLGQVDKPEPFVGPSTENFTPAVKDNTTALLHEPSLRGPWLGPAAATDLLGPSNPSLSNTSGKTLSNLRDNYVTSNASIGGTQENPAVAGSSDMEGPIHMVEYSADQVSNRQFIFFRKKNHADIKIYIP